MSEIRLVLTDFDGTVAEFGKHVVSEAVRQTIIACEDRGVRVVPVTGRYHAMAQPVLELLGFEDLGVFDNGATIQNCKTGEVVWSKWMEPESLRQVARICAPHSKILDYTEDHEESGPADNELERIDMISRPASHVYALVKIGKLAEVTAALSKIPDITFYVAPSTRDNDTDYMGVQVNHVAADKFHGVNALRDIIGVAKDHTLAIGDGDNDLALFKNAAFKIAMGNATGLLKAAADHVVAPVQQDGFAEAMQRFVLA